MRTAILAATALCLAPLGADAASYRIEYQSPTFFHTPPPGGYSPEIQAELDRWNFVMPETIPGYYIAFTIDSSIIPAPIGPGSVIGLGSGWPFASLRVDGVSWSDPDGVNLLYRDVSNNVDFITFAGTNFWLTLGPQMEVVSWQLDFIGEGDIDFFADSATGATTVMDARQVADRAGIDTGGRGSSCVLFCDGILFDGFGSGTDIFRYTSTPGVLTFTKIEPRPIPLPSALPLALTAFGMLFGLGNMVRRKRIGA